jgi:putative aminopeptidase FrvX
MSKKLEINDLETLIKSPSPSGYEEDAIDVFNSIMPSSNRHYHDKIGNSAFFYGQGPTTILLSAHIDEVQARVTYIADNGILSIISTGGICKKSLLASQVQIIADNGALVNGIVEKTPIHCEDKDERDEIGDIDTFKVNIGYESKEDVESLGIHVGSIVIYKRHFNPNFGPNQICACGLDDKIGVFICKEIAKNITKVKGWHNKYTVIVLAAVQEETGLRGATVATRALKPNISIDFDVTFACDNGGGVKKEKYGEIKLGKGGVIEYGPDKSERLNKILVQTAKDNNIPFQYGVSRAGGTNTDVIQLFSDDCETTLVSIPNRNMHTPIEVVDKRDVEGIIELVTKAIVERKL